MNPSEGGGFKAKGWKVAIIVGVVTYWLSVEHWGSVDQGVVQVSITLRIRAIAPSEMVWPFETHSSGLPESLVNPISAPVSATGSVGPGRSAGSSAAPGGCIPFIPIPIPGIPTIPGIPGMPGGRKGSCPSAPGMDLPQPSIPVPGGYAINYESHGRIKGNGTTRPHLQAK